jgi:nucleoside-diphosphate-sugar epimerase
MRILIVGCGYLGTAVGKLLVSQDHEVFGLRRTFNGAGDLIENGITPLTANIIQREALDDLPSDFDYVITTVSSSSSGPDVYLQGTRNLIDWLSPAPPKKYIYTSSTSVYSETDGSAVTEATPVARDKPSTAILVEVEDTLLKAAVSAGFPAVILRLSGIYGPGRGHLFKQFVAGHAGIGSDDNLRFLNMIHRDDAASAIVAAMERGAPGRIYNITDDQPVRLGNFLFYLAAQLKRNLHLTSPAAPEPPARRKRAITSKRVSNARARAELAWTLQYPTYIEGYAAEIKQILSAEFMAKRESPGP